jgi:hypothetical protein
MLRRLGLTTAALALAACADTTQPTEPLSVDLQISADHFHALETEVTYTVLVTEANGNVVSDFETLAVEYSLEGANDWHAVPLTLQTGGSYQGTHQYAGPGAFDLRVTGQRPGQAEAVLHQLTEPVQVIRPHWEAGGYRVEFELEPAELKAGIELGLKFFVMESEEDASGKRPPVTGLSGVAIDCEEANGATTTHDVTESTGGVYQASHSFLASGDVLVTLHFTGADGQPAEVNVPLTLAQ